MIAAEFINSPSGRLTLTIDNAMAFVPAALPPPEIHLGAMVGLIARATQSMGELSGIGRTLPNPMLVIRPFLRKEAVASSKIEGTVTTMSDLVLFEAGKSEREVSPDTIEVRNYVRALEDGIPMLEHLPVSSRLILELHRILMSGVAHGRGAHIIPGEFKRDQNWIGARLIQNARFVPPPPREALECMSDLERYIHSDDEHVPLIVKLALIHYQFETIHPFPDGNGRIGRLLIPLILAERKQMSHPLLYLSSYFEKNYDSYIDLMFDVSRHGAWRPWIEFFLEAVIASCAEGIKKAHALQDLHRDYLQRVQTARSSALLGKLIDELFNIPAMTIRHAQKHLGISYNAAKNNIDRLVEVGILRLDKRLGRPAWFLAVEIVALSNRDEQ
jgi:Fic family protein